MTDKLEVGACEAMTHLPELLRKVRAGSRFTITQRGEPVADLVPTGGAGVLQRRGAAPSSPGTPPTRMLATRINFMNELALRGLTLWDSDPMTGFIQAEMH